MSQDCILPLSWRSLKTEVRQSPIHGHGLFAIEEIGKDEIVAVKGGHIITRAQLADINSRLGPVEIQVDDDLFVAPVIPEERDGSMLYSNHSCDPNLGVRGNIVFVAMRDIRAGEELTHDWCMTDNDTYEVECKCGSPNCRGMLRGNDWQKLELQQRYADYFSDYLEGKIIVAGNRRLKGRWRAFRKRPRICC
jgi:SET domain-containing protein